MLLKDANLKLQALGDVSTIFECSIHPYASQGA